MAFLEFFSESLRSYYIKYTLFSEIGKYFLGIPILAIIYLFDPFIAKEFLYIYVAAFSSMLFIRNVHIRMRYRKAKELPTYFFSKFYTIIPFVATIIGMVALHEVNVMLQHIVAIAMYAITAIYVFIGKYIFENERGYLHRKMGWEAAMNGSSYGSTNSNDSSTSGSGYSYEQFNQNAYKNTGYTNSNSYSNSYSNSNSSSSGSSSNSQQNSGSYSQTTSKPNDNRFINLSEAEAKKLYKTLQKKYHPDNPKTGNLAESKKINEEYMEYQKYKQGA